MSDQEYEPQEAPDRITDGSVAIYRSIESPEYLVFGPQLFYGPRYGEWWEFEAVGLLRLGDGVEVYFEPWVGPFGRWMLSWGGEQFNAIDLECDDAPDVQIVWL